MYRVVACLTKPTAVGMLNDRDSAFQAGVTAVEYRLDLMKPEERRKLLYDPEAFVYEFTIATCRSLSGKGGYAGSEKTRHTLLRHASYMVDMVDIELPSFAAADLPPTEAEVIVSSHYFDHTPDDLSYLYEALAGLGTPLIKLVVKAETLDDSLQVLRLAARARREGRRGVFLAMGEAGTITRVLSPYCGAEMTMASFGTPSAPGQLTVARTVHLVKRAQELYESGEFRSPDEITVADLGRYERTLGLV